MRRALFRFVALADRLAGAAGALAAWLQPLLVVVLVVNVALRYGFGRGFIELEELQWHLYAAGFLLAFADTQAADEHVRVDLLRQRFSPRARAWVELGGSLLMLLPFALIVSVSAFDFFWQSFEIGERSPMPSGLPARWVIKGVLFVSLALLALQALSGAMRSVLELLGETPPARPSSVTVES